MRIALMGDTMIGRLVNEYLDIVGPAVVWGDLLPILKEADLSLLNLECALTTSAKIVPKVFNFKADPAKVSVLQSASIDVVNLANNHVLDYGEEGLLETIKTLDQSGIKYVGAGRNIQEARKPAIFTVEGVRVGILGCTDNEPTWLAGRDKPGTNYLEVPDLQKIRPHIMQLRPQVDVLILSIHWGPNMRQRPTSDFVNFAHALVDCGVDIVHGHSAHIFQGVEMYRGKIILYDTGDFIDDYYVDPQLRNDRSFLFLVDVDTKGMCSLKLIPVLIKDFEVNRAWGEDAQGALKRMQSLSREFNTSLDLVDDMLCSRNLNKAY